MHSLYETSKYTTCTLRDVLVYANILPRTSPDSGFLCDVCFNKASELDGLLYANFEYKEILLWRQSGRLPIELHQVRSKENEAVHYKSIILLDQKSEPRITDYYIGYGSACAATAGIDFEIQSAIANA